MPTLHPMPAQRLPDWMTRLAALVDQRRYDPFAWGSHDCATWAADCVLATTGTDPLADLRGAWSTQTQASETIVRLGGLQQAVSDRLGPPLANARHAQRGDVMLCLMAPGGPSLAVCLGHNVAGPGRQGMVFTQVGSLPINSLVVWGVGHA